MSRRFTVQVPDIGDFEDVAVIEIHVAPGASVAVEDPLITLESDKATMDIPSPRAGTVVEVLVAVDQTVSEGAAIVVLELPEGASVAAPARPTATEAPRGSEPAEVPAPPAAPAPAPSSAPPDAFDVVVLGSGPGGYTAAFRAADLGLRVALVERYPTLGGVCLNVGCIPSKTLLHMAEVVSAAEELREHGVDFGTPRFDLDRIRARKNAVVRQLVGGLGRLAAQRKVEVVTGEGRFTGLHSLEVTTADGPRTLPFRHAIVAAGSQSAEIPGLPLDDPRVMDSTDALELEAIPKRLLVIGGGIIGLEMATVYDALGSEVTVVELLDRLMPGADPDLVRPLQKRIEKRYAHIWLATRVTRVEARADGLQVSFEGKDAPASERYDRVLVAVGRVPNGHRIGAEHAGLKVDERGFLPVDDRQRTNVPHIFAIGDIAGAPLLAHKATHEGKVAAEVIAGLPSAFDARTIPSVAYTDPEVAWMGLTEARAREEGVEVTRAVFPWAASGRALGTGRGEGLTKLLFAKQTGRLVGAGIVGPHAGELISETVLALEMGADAEDLGLSIHPHPTLSETVAFAAEMAEGTITDLMPPRRR